VNWWLKLLGSQPKIRFTDSSLTHIPHTHTQPEYFYFEVLECGRRLLLAAVVGVVAADSAASPSLGILIALFFVYVLMEHKPYREASSNLLVIVLAFSLVFFFLSGKRLIHVCGNRELTCVFLF
jgi:hypothetical protein